MNVRDKLKKVRLKSDRVITADFVEEAERLFADALKERKPEEIDYKAIAMSLTKKSISVDTAQRRLYDIFPRKRLIRGAIPARLAEEFLEKNPRLLVPRKLREAAKIIRRNPGRAISKVAKQVGLSDRTILDYLRKAGIELDAAERGRRTLEAKGYALDRTPQYYGYYYSMDNVLLAGEALKRNNNDRKKAGAELEKTLGDRKARKILKVIFPANRVDSLGVDECVNAYRRWRKENPINPAIAEARKRIRRRNRKGSAYYERELVRKRKNSEIIRAQKRLLRLIGRRIVTDRTIPNKELFLYIAADLLRGRFTEAIALSIEHADLSKDEKELAVIGIRRRITDYFTSERFRAEERTAINADLDRVKFYENINAERSSSEVSDVVKYATSFRRNSVGQVIEVSNERLIEKAFDKLVRIPSQAVQYKPIARVKRLPVMPQTKRMPKKTAVYQRTLRRVA